MRQFRHFLIALIIFLILITINICCNYHYVYYYHYYCYYFEIGIIIKIFSIIFFLSIIYLLTFVLECYNDDSRSKKDAEKLEEAKKYYNEYHCTDDKQNSFCCNYFIANSYKARRYLKRYNRFKRHLRK